MSALLGTIASAHVDTTPAYLLEDTWTGSNGAAWNTTRWPQTRGGTVDIQSNAGRLTAGGRPLAFTEVTATDFELLVKGTWNTLSGINPEIGWRFSQNIASSDPNAGYAIQMGGSTVTLYRLSGYSSVASAGSSGLNVNGSFWFRINVVGTTHKVRWWATSGSEPGTWQINTTNSNYEGGRFLLTNWGSGTATWDDLQITDLGPTGNLAARWYSTFTGKMSASASAISGSDFTICGWFRYELASVQMTVASFSTGPAFFQIAVNTSGALVIVRSTGGNYLPGISLTINSWYFVAVSHVASTGVNTIRLFPDGGSVTAATSTTGVGIPASSTFYVGGAGTDSWTGRLAAVKVWTAALSTAEMDAERNSYAAVRSSNLWAQYKLNVDPLAADTSGNARTLTYVDAVPHRAQGPTTPT